MINIASITQMLHPEWVACVCDLNYFNINHRNSRSILEKIFDGPSFPRPKKETNRKQTSIA